MLDPTPGDHIEAGIGPGGRFIAVGKNIRQVVINVAGGWAALAAIALALVAAASFVLWKHFEPDPRMTGEFNIAIAPFAGPQPQGQDLANSLRTSIEDQKSTLKASTGLDIGVALLRSESPDRLRAEALATQVNANMVIYGEVTAQGTLRQLQPRFFLRIGAYEAAELIGDHELGSPIPLGSTSSAKRKQDAQVLDRATRVLSLASALEAFAASNYTSAAAALESVRSEWLNEPGGDVLDILLANVRIREGNFSAAEELCQAAVDGSDRKTSAFARAHACLGSAQFGHALGDPLPVYFEDVDAGLLDQAVSNFDQAAQASVQPEQPVVRAKLLLNRARAYLRRANAKPGTDLDAAGRVSDEAWALLAPASTGPDLLVKELAARAAQFRGIIGFIRGEPKEAIARLSEASSLARTLAEAESTNPLYSDLYAQTLDLMGQMYALGRQNAEAEKSYLQAVGAYQAGARVTRDEAKLAGFSDGVGRLYERLNNADASHASYAESIQHYTRVLQSPSVNGTSRARYSASLADVYLRLKDRESAATWYAAALASEPPGTAASRRYEELAAETKSGA